MTQKTQTRGTKNLMQFNAKC